MGSVSLAGVSKTFRTSAEPVRAVDRMDLTVRDGELLVLVGPSGCGKTTTLRLIAGLESPDAGTIRIGDKTVNDTAPKDRDVGMVFQDYALYPHMTVFKNLGFGLKMRGHPRDAIERRVQEVSASLDIADLLDRKPANLSGGQRQRVALGRAIAREPQVFLFDEPLANLDLRLRHSTRTLLRTLHRQIGTTTIHVTHDQEEAMTLGDRLAVMNEGKILQIGAPLEVYRSPVNRFVAGFLGTPQMNFIDSVVKDVSTDRITLESPLGMLLVPRSRCSTEPPPAGTNVTMGLRPEHVRVDASGAGASVEHEDSPEQFEMQITNVEALGDRTYVHLQSDGGTELIATTTADTELLPGAAATVVLQLSDAHLFSVRDDEPRF